MSQSTGPISIRSSCNGTFFVTEDGIYSTEPIEVKSVHWDGDTLVLEGPENGNNVINNVVVRGATISSLGGFGGLFGNVGKMTIGSGNNAGEYVIVDGVTYKREQPAVEPANTKKIEIFWSEFDRVKPTLASLDLQGEGSFEIKIPLDSECDIDGSGTTSVGVHGNNPDSAIIASISGTGSIIGNGLLGRLSISMSGMGNVSGFHITKALKISVSGVGNANLTHEPIVKPVKKMSGMGQINLKPVHLK